MAQDSDDSSSTNWMLVILGVFTFACAVGAVWYFIAAQIYLLKANEMGDFIAGVFAPLAFLWLIAAVFLQKSELIAQRKELKEARAVALQHVEEARRNAAFIGEQTKILSDQRIQAVQDFADRQIDQCIMQIDSLFSRIANSTLVRYSLNGTQTKVFPIRKNEGNSPAQYIMLSIANFDTAMKKHFPEERLSALKNQNAEVKKSFTAKLAAIASAIEEINKLANTASAPKRLQVASLEFDRFLGAYEVYKHV
ncbi:hypothetical protein [Parvibaculum sp.]|uniref:hypothetical protein n=1 Tax=Parvibaculum sp. TaxID=2024848 RepID=UPI003BA8F231